MTEYQWITLALGAFGFVATWILGAFKVGVAIEQIQSTLRAEIDQERDKIFHRIDELEGRFNTEQRSQDHNFGEVGAALRQKMADIQKEVHKIELWGISNYVQKPELDSVRSDIKALGANIKEMFTEMKADFKEDIREMKEGKH